MNKEIFGLIISIVIAQAAGGLGALFNIQNIPKWYSFLNKPKLNPPNKIFGPVWTTLFLLMSIAAWLVWKQTFSFSFALWLYIVQLVLNVLWSGLFFGLRRPDLAFVEIVFLWLLIFATLIKFWSISPAAGWLMLPYILWVTFAAYLNFEIWRLN